MYSIGTHTTACPRPRSMGAHFHCAFSGRGEPKLAETCRRERNGPTSFLCGPSLTRLRCSPGDHPRNPAADVRAICLVLRAKRLLQRRLFVRDDKQVEAQPEHGTP